MPAIDGIGDAADEIVDLWFLLGRRGVIASAFLQRREYSLGVLADVIGLVLIGLGDTQQHRHECRPAEALLLWEIRSSPEWPGVAIEKHRQRPAALFAKAVQRAHVDRINVGTLFAIDFDVDEELVHDAGGRLIFEAFVGHHMAPVAGGIPDR